MKIPAALVFVVLSVMAVNMAEAAGVRNAVEIGGEEIRYLAQPGKIALTKGDGSLRGEIFYTAYKRAGLREKQLARRPVVFLFNGGPGSSSAWLHLGAFGPQRLVLGEGGLSKPPRPYRTTSNEHSLIDVADLVFIDPIGTGFSRAANLLVERTFYTFRGDVRSIADTSTCPSCVRRRAVRPTASGRGARRTSTWWSTARPSKPSPGAIRGPRVLSPRSGMRWPSTPPASTPASWRVRP